VERVITNKRKHLVSASILSLNPTLNQFVCHCTDNDKTVITSNQSMDQKMVTNHIKPLSQHANAIAIVADCAITNTGAMSIFIMEGVDV
jgi:hypothetical protein